MPTSATVQEPATAEEFLGALYKGGEFLASGRADEAREHLEKAHQLEPQNEKAQNLLGLTYFKLGLYDRAAEVYQRLVNENPTDATLRVNLGLVFLKTNDLERCVHEFRTATEIDPAHKKAHNYLGLALAQQGTYAQAQEHFVLAGSEQMAQKMSRAISSPSAMLEAPSLRGDFSIPNEVPRQAPQNVILGQEQFVSAAGEEQAIEVMSDEELPSDVYVVPEEILVAETTPVSSLHADWGEQLGAAHSSGAGVQNDDIRFAEDEGPGINSLRPVLDTDTPTEELLVIDAVAEQVVPGAEAAPAWLTAEEESTSAETAWVTETVTDLPVFVPETPMELMDARWADAIPPVSAEAWNGPTPFSTSAEEEPMQQAYMAEVQANPATEAPWAEEESVVPSSEPAAWSPQEEMPPEQFAAESSAVPSWQQAETDWAEVVPPEPTREPIQDTSPEAPFPITVEEPEQAEHHAIILPPVGCPPGYVPLSAQPLGDFAASDSWAQEPVAGPFFIGNEGLAVAVQNELLVRLTGLVAVVGGVQVVPENRRRHGRPTLEPFGEESVQLQRVSGQGMIYLDPGRSQVYALELSEGPHFGADGAYFREELVFSFEEPINFENGCLSADGQAFDLVHLKGTGRVLLQLEGGMRTMVLMEGAPMVIPLERVVGWFGQVSPRLVGFGGRWAVELTGVGYALLGMPAERN